MQIPKLMAIMDGYKLIHHRFYPQGTTRVQSNWTARGTRIGRIDHTVTFGLQYVLNELDQIADRFFNTPRQEVIDHFVARNAAYLGPDNTVGTEHVEALHELGYLPLEYHALPEGTLVPLRVPHYYLQNTIDHAFWLPNAVETFQSTQIWLPITTATKAYYLRRMLMEKVAATGGDEEFIQFLAHDFSMRGMQDFFSGNKSGAGHLLSFRGTDTLSAIEWIDEHYPGANNGWVAASVPASEHATQCSWGKPGEIDAYRYALKQIPSGPVSLVSDTYDLWNVCLNILPALKPEIMGRDGKLVVRPDSGFPEDILLGARGDNGRAASAPGSPAWRGVLEILGDEFGTTLNDKGFRRLDPHVGAIYGDSITHDRAEAILDRQARQGWEATIEVFGIGSYEYGYVTRDTFNQAQKATWAEIDGIGVDMFKDPITDGGEKKSAKGRLAVLPSNGTMVLVNQATPEQEAQSLLKPVWRDGKFIRRETFGDIRNRMWPGLFDIAA